MLATDGIRILPKNQKVARPCGSVISGRLYKGQAESPAHSSIPTKYRTIVTNNSDKYGFLRQTKRFRKYDTTEVPGPGTYSAESETFEAVKPSFSKKGTGGFASKDKRSISFTAKNCSPPSNIYTLPSYLATKSDFNRNDSSRLFARPIAQITSKENFLPAPNKYDVLNPKLSDYVFKSDAKGAKSAFVSRSSRNFFSLKDIKNLPAPGAYNIETPRDENPVTSPFKSKTKRKFFDMIHVPGPADYSPGGKPTEPKRLLLPRRHYLCISAPAIAMPDQPVAPGPGTYDLVDYHGEPIRFMSTAAFVSNTSRWVGDFGDTSIPGPGSYHPQGLKKQSFHYNSSKKWIA